MSICKLSKWEVPTGSQEWIQLPTCSRIPALPSAILVLRQYIYNFNWLLGWCNNNCDFCVVELCHLIVEYISLKKCGYVIHHFNVHFSFYVFSQMTS